MAASDWIAVGAGIIALASLGLAGFTFRHQAHEERSDAQQKLADQISDIQKELAKLGPPSANARAIDLVANNMNVNAALQALVVRSNQLIRAHQLEPDWFETVVLASAFVNVGDMGGADIWVNRAVQLARRRDDEHTGERPLAALMLSLRIQALFYFSRGAEGDADRGREACSQARAAVQSARDEQGPVFTSTRLIELFVAQASFELMDGANDRVAALIRGACEEWQNIDPPGPRYNMCVYIATVLRNQSVVGPADLELPQEFLSAMANLPPDPTATGLEPPWGPPPRQAPLPDPAAMHSIVEAAQREGA